MTLIHARQKARLLKALAKTLDSTCTVYRAPRVDDGQGGATQDYQPSHTLPCRVADISAPSASIGAQVGGQPVGLVQKLLCFAPGADVQWDDLLVVNGQTYRYVDVSNENTEEVWLRVLVERREAGAIVL